MVDFSGIDIPLPINPRIDVEKSKKYQSSNVYPSSHLRNLIIFDNQKEVDEWVVEFIHTHIFPKFTEYPPYNQIFPHSISFLKDNTKLGATLLKDSTGFTQQIHHDPHFNVLAGSIHLQDSPDNGTAFHRQHLNSGEWIQTHRGPSEKLSGSIWSNMPDSYHSVTPATSDRFIYLIVGIWQLIPQI